MPPKVKVPDGELTTPELRKLIRAHNLLSKITIPKGTDRLGIIKLIQMKGYKVNHKKKSIDPTPSRRDGQITLTRADKVLPKKKTESEKKEAKVKRDKKKVVADTEAFKKRDAQVKALGKIVAKRKKGVPIKKPEETVPEFTTVKQLEKYFMTSLNTFEKKEINPFIQKVKLMKTKKEIQDGKTALRRIGSKRILDILEANEDLFEDEEKYEELEEIYEKRYTRLTNVITARLEALKSM